MSFWASANPTQKYARVMEIACYVLMLPAFAALYILYDIQKGGSLAFSSREWWVSVSSYAAFAFGFTLMVFYMLSARLLLSRRFEITGWVASIVFNLIPFGLVAYSLLEVPGNTNPPASVSLVMLAILVWPSFAIYYSAQALYSFLQMEGREQ